MVFDDDSRRGCTGRMVQCGCPVEWLLVKGLVVQVYDAGFTGTYGQWVRTRQLWYSIRLKVDHGG